MRIRYFRAISQLVLVFFLLIGSAPCFGELYYPPDCEGPGCLRTAETTSWPAALEDGSFSVELRNIAITIPSPPERVVRQWGGDVLFVCQDGSWLNFSLESRFSSAEGVSLPEKSSFTVADSGQFIFTKTTRDTPPDDPNDLWIWRWALFLKSQVFGADNPVYTATRESLTIYFWEDISIKDTYLAYVFDASRTDSYVRIFAQNLSFEDFKKIVGSATLR